MLKQWTLNVLKDNSLHPNLAEVVDNIYIHIRCRTFIDWCRDFNIRFAAPLASPAVKKRPYISKESLNDWGTAGIYFRDTHSISSNEGAFCQWGSGEGSQEKLKFSISKWKESSKMLCIKTNNCFLPYWKFNVLLGKHVFTSCRSQPSWIYMDMNDYCVCSHHTLVYLQVS